MEKMCHSKPGTAFTAFHLHLEFVTDDRSKNPMLLLINIWQRDPGTGGHWSSHWKRQLVGVTGSRSISVKRNREDNLHMNWQFIWCRLILSSPLWKSSSRHWVRGWFSSAFCCCKKSPHCRWMMTNPGRASRQPAVGVSSISATSLRDGELWVMRAVLWKDI